MAIYIPTTLLVGEPIHIGRGERQKIEATIEHLVGLLDLADGDADVELNGDETDHTHGEDEGHCGSNTNSWSGPGCPIADPDMSVDDFGELVDEDGTEEIVKTLPQWGVDQSKGATNEREACRLHFVELAQGGR
jgi:hypothetical protein